LAAAVATDRQFFVEHLECSFFCSFTKSETIPMSLQVRVESLVLRLAAEFKTIHGHIGTLANLSTLDKTNLVSAINELRSQITTLSGATFINDVNAAATGTTFSASKITALLDALKADLLGGADAAFDTLKELQTAILSDQTGISALLAAVDKRVRFDAAQALTAPEQLQARQNMGAVASSDIGNTNTDFVAIFDAALVA
jgi:capsid protein